MHQKLYPISVQDHAAYSNVKCMIRKKRFKRSPKNLGAKPQLVPALLLRF